GRDGWHHYLAREAGQPVAARSFWLPEPGAAAWLGIDGPVPGVMTSDHQPDAEIIRTIVARGLELGASGFIADIEAPSPVPDTPAYGIFERLGFETLYVRRHWMAVSRGRPCRWETRA